MQHNAIHYQLCCNALQSLLTITILIDRRERERRGREREREAGESRGRGREGEREREGGGERAKARQRVAIVSRLSKRNRHGRLLSGPAGKSTSRGFKW